MATQPSRYANIPLAAVGCVLQRERAQPHGHGSEERKARSGTSYRHATTRPGRTSTGESAASRDSLPVDTAIDPPASSPVGAARDTRLALEGAEQLFSAVLLVERLFAELTTRLLRRGVHRGVTDLEADIRTRISAGTTTPAPASGPRPRNGSSSRSAHTANDFLS